jgi:hypothetical protein
MVPDKHFQNLDTKANIRKRKKITTSMKQILTLLFVQLYKNTITRNIISFYILFLKSRCSPYMHAADAHKN